jgi:hypothetical protein
MHHYGNCPPATLDDPPKHSIAFYGTIVAIKPMQCGEQLTVTVKRSSSPSLPATIVIEIGSCTLAPGVGQDIRAVVGETPKKPGLYEEHSCKD